MKWMAGLGIKLEKGRTSNYEEIVEYVTATYKTATADEVQRIFPDFVSSMIEVVSFISIYKAFKSVPVPQLTSVIEKLQKGVNGPIKAADETPDSTAARNFLFEAVVAARVHRPDKGVEAILDARSDTGIRFNGKKIWVECKRVTSIEKIESNARRASRQLETIFAEEGRLDSSDSGIVVLDVSKILNRGDKIFVARNDDELVKSVDEMMDGFIKRYSRIWQQVYLRRHQKIIGTIVSFSFMASSEARNLLVHSAQWGMNPRLGIDASDERIQRQLVAALKATP